MPVGQPPTGIELSVASAESEAGLALLNALHRNGIEIRGVLQPTMAANEIRLQCIRRCADFRYQISFEQRGIDDGTTLAAIPTPGRSAQCV